MIAIAIGLVGPAQEAGIKVPPDLEKYDREEFPHWMVYTTMQLGVPMPSPTSHWSNAKVVAAVPDDQIRKVTPEDLEQLGFERGHSIP